MLTVTLELPNCRQTQELVRHLGSWLHPLETYGSGLDEEMRRVMLLNVIPNDMRLYGRVYRGALLSV